jgi:fibronectin type III domain protein
VSTRRIAILLVVGIALWVVTIGLAASAQTITATPLTCAAGTTCRPTIVWSAWPCSPTANASPSGGGWGSTKPPSGSMLVDAITATRTYTLSCQVGTGSMSLTWEPPTENTDGSPLTDLAGFRLYLGTQQGIYPSNVTLSDPGLRAYSVQQLLPATWYTVIAARNAAGLESEYSNVASKVVTSSPVTTTRSVTVTVAAAPPPPATDIQTGGTFTTLTTVRRYFVGDSVPITTPAVAGATRYEWEIEHVDNRIVDARSSTTPSTTWTPSRAGLFVARVRPCNATGCAAWLSTVDRGYVAHAWLRAPQF